MSRKLLYSEIRGRQDFSQCIVPLKSIQSSEPPKMTLLDVPSRYCPVCKFFCLLEMLNDEALRYICPFPIVIKKAAHGRS